MSWNQRIHQALEQRNEQHLLRRRVSLDSPQQAEVEIDGQRLINFCSNDYLGLACEGGDALAKAASKWNLGSGASHLVCGHSSAHHGLEQALADYTGYPRALLFSSGFMANVGTISALAQRGDLIFQDKLNHASLLDGAQLSRAKLLRYRHCDYAQLDDMLANASDDSSEKLIVSDSIFSMDGDLADVAQLANIAEKHQSLLMIDDAHGLGILGAKENNQGNGVRDHFGLSHQQLPVYVGTLGKALGGYGAFVAGSEELIDYLVQFARPYIYTTALPPALAEAMLFNLELMKQPERRNTLNQHIEYFRQQAEKQALPLMPSESAIQPLLIGDADKAMTISEQLKQRGLWVSAIRPPTVPAGSARLRITLTAGHSREQIDLLLKALAEVMQ
ncbi:8-amino-7-oxononanoate synthase [Bacterioplanoides sp.]|uniref:8-amino-7-oxononanoate synthase n=1 Tax=Bacterioplanoides sp. TaxID=2066072 RepID=UPI003B5CEC25